MSICGMCCRNMANMDPSTEQAAPRFERSEASGARTLDRTFKVLDLLAKERIPSLTEISRHLGLTVNPTLRLLKTLLHWRYAHQGPRSRHHRMELQESVCLANIDRTQGVFVQHVGGPRRVGVHVRAGTRVTLHATAAGKVLVAWHETGHGRRCSTAFPGRSTRSTPSTGSTPSARSSGSSAPAATPWRARSTRGRVQCRRSDPPSPVRSRRSRPLPWSSG